MSWLSGPYNGMLGCNNLPRADTPRASVPIAPDLRSVDATDEPRLTLARRQLVGLLRFREWSILPRGPGAANATAPPGQRVGQCVNSWLLYGRRISGPALLLPLGDAAQGARGTGNNSPITLRSVYCGRSSTPMD
jgi:hypothetical protein